MAETRVVSLKPLCRSFWKQSDDAKGFRGTTLDRPAWDHFPFVILDFTFAIDCLRTASPDLLGHPTRNKLPRGCRGILFRQIATNTPTTLPHLKPGIRGPKTNREIRFQPPAANP